MSISRSDLVPKEVDAAQLTACPERWSCRLSVDRCGLYGSQYIESCGVCLSIESSCLCHGGRSSTLRTDPPLQEGKFDVVARLSIAKTSGSQAIRLPVKSYSNQIHVVSVLKRISRIQPATINRSTVKNE